MNNSLWQHPDFMRLWAGQTVSRLGSVVTRTAVPIVAVLVLGAGPAEMAGLVIAASLAVLLVGFVAGAWVDRVRRRPLLIGSDIIRAGVLFSIPVAHALDALSMNQLYVVMFVDSCLAVVFNAAYPAYVPSLIGTDRLVEGNSKLATSSSIAEIGGPSIAGALVSAFSAPFAVLIDAFSFLASAVSLLLIRTPEPARPVRGLDIPLRHEILEGLQLIRRHRILYPLAIRSIIGHTAGSFYGVLYTLFLVEELDLEPFVLGVVISAGGIGSLVGSFAAARVIRRLGLGRAFIWSAVGASAIGILTPLAQGPLFLVVLMVLLPQLLGDGLQTIEEVAEISLVQGQTPDRILGRVNATMEVLTHGIAFPIGALLAATAAEWVGIRGGIFIGWAGMAIAILPLVLSPLTRLRMATDAPESRA
jgi:MFS family permease